MAYGDVNPSYDLDLYEGVWEGAFTTVRDGVLWGGYRTVNYPDWDQLVATMQAAGDVLTGDLKLRVEHFYVHGGPYCLMFRGRKRANTLAYRRVLLGIGAGVAAFAGWGGGAG